MDVFANTSCGITLEWVIDCSDGIEHLAFHIIWQSYMVYFVNFSIVIHFIVTWESFDQTIKTIKVLCMLLLVVCWSLSWSRGF
jgi:hypothetical protein